MPDRNEQIPEDVRQTNNQPGAKVKFRNRGTSRRNGTIDRSSMEFEGTMEEYLRLNPALRDADMAERAEATPSWIIWVVGVITAIIAVALFLWVAWFYKAPTVPTPPVSTSIIMMAPATITPQCVAVQSGCEVRNAALSGTTNVPAACAQYVVSLRASGGCY